MPIIISYSQRLCLHIACFGQPARYLNQTYTCIQIYMNAHTLYTHIQIMLAYKAISTLAQCTRRRLTYTCTPHIVEASLSLLCERFSNREQRKRQVSCRTKNTGASDPAQLGSRREEKEWKGIGGRWITYNLDLLRHRLKNLSPEVQVNPLGAAVHHLRHLGRQSHKMLQSSEQRLNTICPLFFCVV